jgi:DNA-binding NarL/FixJ family response regulator
VSQGLPSQRRLDPEQTAIRLARIQAMRAEGLTFKVIAQRLGLSASAVSTIVARLRKQERSS